MEGELGGWLWLFIGVAAVALLAGVMAFGFVSYRRHFRSPRPEERSRQHDEERHAAMRHGPRG
jgi:hypothetical protein